MFPDHATIVEEVNKILARFPDTKLTLRQIYYQLVAALIIENNEKSYKNLSRYLVKARENGEVDDSRMEDRGRQTIGGDTEKTDPETFYAEYENWFRNCWKQYSRPMWDGQENYCEVWCLPRNTPIITNNGVIDIGKIRPSDMVLSSDGVFNKVTSVFERKYEGNIIKITTMGLIDIKTTPDHKFLVARVLNPKSKGIRKKLSPPEYIPASDLKKFDYLMVPRITKLKDVSYITPVGKNKSKILSRVAIDERFCKVIGFYLSEGNIRKDDRTIQFTFGNHEEPYIDIVNSWGKSINLNPFVAKGSGTKIIYISSKPLANWFKINFGNGAYEKHFPEWVMLLPREKQLTILKYYFLGDGTLKDNTRRCITAASKSKSLLLQAQLLLIRNGFFCSVKPSHDATGVIYRLTVAGKSVKKLCSEWGLQTPTNGKTTFNNGRIEDNYVYFPIRNTITEQYSGVVYNIEVENSKSYCIPCAVHNCEKDALSRIVSDVARKYGVTTCVARGYSSYTFINNAASRINRICDFTGPPENKRTPVILYFGDFDPNFMCLNLQC